MADPLFHLIGKTAVKHTAEEYVRTNTRVAAVNANRNAMTTRVVEEASDIDEVRGEVRNANQNGCYETCQAYAPIAKLTVCNLTISPKGKASRCSYTTE